MKLNKLFSDTCILLVFSIFGLILAEIGLRAYFSHKINYDLEMWKYAVNLKMRVQDAREHIHIPSSAAHLMGVEMKINSRGLRDYEYSYDKTPGTYRILSIGDSYTLGWGVPLDKTFTKLIENKLNLNKLRHRYEVINMGVGNYNAEQELELFRRDGIKFHPDAVLLFIYINDAELYQRHTSNFLSRYSYLYVLLVQGYVHMQSLLNPSHQYIQVYNKLYMGSSWERYRKIIAQFAEEMRRNRLCFIPIILPDLKELKRYPFIGIHTKIREEFSDLGYAPIDLLPDFSGKVASDLWVARDDSHPNIKAHDIIAKSVYFQLQSRLK